MSDGTAEALAREILEGTYAPSPIEDCNADLPLDRNPQTVRFTQFVLFNAPEFDPRGSGAPEYLILPPYRIFNPGDPQGPIRNDLLNPLADALLRSLPTERIPAPDAPIDDIRDRLRDIRDRLPELGPRAAAAPGLSGDARDLSGRWPDLLPEPEDLPDPELPDDALRDRYGAWFAEERRRATVGRLEPVIQAGLLHDHELPSDVDDLLGTVRGTLGKIFLPDPYRPFDTPHPHFALCLTYEQVWEPRGYTRGELLNTISLAAGEQLTTELHSWDKNTVKSERQLLNESELRVSESLTQRDVLTVARQLAESSSSSFNASVEVTIPKINLPLTVGGSSSEQLSENLNQSLERTRERTVQAAQTVKSSRKQRIEISREIGREQKQTRTIANTNRCHSLSYHYFEVMANYLVTTRLVEVTPCILLPNPRRPVTAAWVLCHEGVLTEALLDRAYLPGFEGARRLETHEAYQELEEQKALADPEVPDPFEQELRPHIDGIVGAYRALLSARNRVERDARSTECTVAAAVGKALGWAVCVAAKSGVQRLRQMLYLTLLYADDTRLNALKKLESDAGNADMKPSDALRAFFSAVTPRDYRYTPVDGTIAKGLDALGLPRKLVDALLAWGLMQLATDDAGLYNAVKGAAEKLKDILQLPAPEEQEDDLLGEGFSSMDLARARVAFEALRCHIEANRMHYLQAIWLREHPDPRFLRLQGHGMVAAVLDNDLLGFLGHKAAYPITDLEAVSAWVDYNDMMRGLEPEPDEPRLVTVPTQGIVDEAVLSECDVCEEFIRETRRLDLRMQEAETRQRESEAERYESRVADEEYTPPDLPPADSVTIHIHRTEEEPSS